MATVAIEAPAEGGFFACGDLVPFRVTAADAEDGSVAGGTIDCADLSVRLEIGHENHTHPATPLDSCEGIFEMPHGHGSPDDNTFVVVAATYTDRGVDGTGALQASATHRLYPRRLQAEYHALHEGTLLEDSQDPIGGLRHLAWIDDGDWVAFERMSIEGIRFVGYRIASAGSGGRIEVRADAPDGPLLSTALVEPTGG